METYSSNPKQYLYDSQFGDFRLALDDIDETNILIYQTIEPRLNNTKRYVIAIRGSQTMYDYLVDIDVMRDYSSDTNGVENYFHLYSRLLDDVYDQIVNTITNNTGTDTVEYYITGHSLGGKLAMDAFNRLITNNMNTGVYCYIYNPYTIHDIYAEDLLNNIDLAIAGEEPHFKYFALRTDLYVYITEGDYISALYSILPGNVFVYPSISLVQNYLMNLFNIAYNAILSNNNHSLSNFTNKTDADIELTMKAEYHYDAVHNTITPIHLSIGRLSNALSKDLSSVAGTLNNNAHLHMKAVSDTEQFMNLVVLETDDDHIKYLWEWQQQHLLFRTYFLGNGQKIITPIYKITNHEYANNYHYVFLKEWDIPDNPLYNIIKVNSTGTISNTALCVFTEKQYTPVELSNKRSTGIDLQFTNLADLPNLTQPNSIQRRQWSIHFGESSSVVPIQTEDTWHDQDDLRRLIKHDLFTHSPITSTDGITIGFNRDTTGSGNIDVHTIKWYLNDIGGGNLKWGHLQVGNRDDYKIKLEHTSEDLYLVKSNTWTSNAMYTPTYEIVWYDTNRYFIINTDVINTGQYLKQPTYTEWSTLQTETIYAQIEDSKLYFKDLVWDTWDGITGSPDEYLFTIDNYSNISLPATVSDSLTNNVNGTATDTFLLYPNYLRSPDGDKILTMEYNGNLIIWHKGVGAPWHANTYNTGNGLVVQADGNLIVYDGGSGYDKITPALWNGGTHYSTIANSGTLRTIKITNTPALEIYDGNNNLIKTYS